MHAGQQAAMRQDWTKAAQAYRLGSKDFPDAMRLRGPHPYLLSRVKLGQAVQVYDELGERREQLPRDSPP